MFDLEKILKFLDIEMFNSMLSVCRVLEISSAYQIRAGPNGTMIYTGSHDEVFFPL